MKTFLIIAYDGYVGVEDQTFTLDELLSEEQSWRPREILEWAETAAVGSHMLSPPNRKGASEFAIVRII